MTAKFFVDTNILLYAGSNAAADQAIGPAYTNSGCTFNGTYVEPLSMGHGVALGGANMPLPTIYQQLMTGGPAIGGASMPNSMVFGAKMQIGRAHV